MAEPKAPQSSSDDTDIHLSDNSVEYLLFLIDDHLDSQKQILRLNELKKQEMQLTKNLTEEYIWQKDELNLAVVAEHGTWPVIAS
jgi:hypothetical protein